MLRLTVFVLAGAVALAAPSGAQNCVGRGSFRYGRVALGGTVTVTGGSRGFGAYGTYGTPASWYAGATVGTTSIDGGGGTSLNLGGSLGYQLPIGRALAFCPYANLGSSALRNVSTITGTRITTRTNSYGLGGTLGWRYEDSDELDVIPALGVQWQRISVTSPELRYSGPANSGSASFSIGFIAERKWAIVPAVSSSFSSGTSYVYSLSVGYSFGK